MNFKNSTPSMQPLLDLSNSDIAKVNNVILGNVHQSVPLINDIAKHIISSGGKRLRPCLTIACAKLLDYNGEKHIKLAAAVELIHTATLLHDDVVDESTMRRGLETANNIWSNQASVLVGDFLFSRSFQLMVAAESLEILELLSNTSATISQGEVKQLTAVGDVETTQDIYFDIINAKTAALFSASCEIAPMIAGKKHLCHYFAEFGTSLGIAFQLIDDALDYSSDAKNMGKNIGDDLRDGKMTLPAILAYQAGNISQQKTWENIIAKDVKELSDLQQAIDFINQHDTINLTIERAYQYLLMAEKALLNINGNKKVTEVLMSTLAFCLNRKS